MSTYVLGIDLGTTSIKVSVINVQTNEIEDHYTEATNCEVPGDLPAAHEQFVPKIISTLNYCLEQIKPCFRESISKIGICGQMHGVLLWNIKTGVKPWTFENKVYKIDENQVSGLYTWQDARCDQAFLATLPTPDSHLAVSTGFGIPTIFWLLRNKPEFLKKYNRAGLLSSFVVAMLCDQEEVQTSYQNAASWGYFNCREKQWNLELLKKNNFPTELLPAVKPSGTTAGILTENWYGLPTGISVGVDLGDLQCSVISTIDTLQDAVINFSTSAQVAFVIDKFTPSNGPPRTDPQNYWPYFDNMYVVIAASLNGGNTLVFFVDMLESWFFDLGVIVDKERIWDILIKLGMDESSESNLNIKPTCLGERFDPNSTASVKNITGSNLSLGQVFRALCRGLIENLHNQLPAKTLKQSKCNRIVGNGSGLYKNKILQNEVERIYQLPLVFANVGDASKGAAIAVNRYGSYEKQKHSSICCEQFIDNQSTSINPSTRRNFISKPCQCPSYCKCNSKLSQI